MYPLFRCIRRFFVGVFGPLVVAGASPIFAQGGFVNFEAKQTRPIQLSPDGQRLFVVNTPDARLSVFDVVDPSMPVLIAEIPVGIEPVSVSARTDDEVWVVNEVSDSVSVVSVSRGVVVDTLYVQDEPADVVFANGRAFVSGGRKNRIVVLDAESRQPLASIPVLGENPRALAASADGTRVYAAFALSGNRTTLVPFEAAPAPPPPANPSLPAPPQVGLIVDATDPAWAPSVIQYVMPDNDVVEIDTEALSVVRYFSRVGTVNLALAVRPGSGDLYVANTDARNLVRFEPALRGHIVENRLSRIAVEDGAVTHFDLNPGTDYGVLPNPAVMSNALAQATSIVFGPSGSSLFLASFGTDRIARVRADDGLVTGLMEVGNTPGTLVDSRNKRGPRGLALGRPGTQRLYVVNRIANTLAVMDTMRLRRLVEIPVGSHDPTPEPIRQGRGFLYDAKLSGNGTASCSSCHVDAEMDMIAWDLGDPDGSMTTVRSELLGVMVDFEMHPMKGPMTTQTLRGLEGLDPLHWRGDRPDFTHFNGAFDTLLGGSPLSQSDMEAYRDFIDTIRFQPNPNQNLDRTLPTAFAGGNPVAGRNTYVTEVYNAGLTCNSCHVLPTGSNRLLIPAQALQESQAFKVPQLRNIYKKLNLDRAPGAVSVGGFGLVHDGVDPGLVEFLSRPVFGLFANDTVRKRNLNAFVQCFDTGMAPAVGYSRTIDSANVEEDAVRAAWTLLEGQAAQGNCDLVVKGVLGGVRRGFVYRPGPDDYLMDRGTLETRTRAELELAVSEGDVVTVMGVPRGSGFRMGVDRDRDGVFDGNAPSPLLRVMRGGTEVVVSWPANSPGYILERAGDLSGGGWELERSYRGVIGDRIQVTNTVAADAAFYRLREL